MAISNAKVSVELYAQSQKHSSQALGGLLQPLTSARCLTLPVKSSADGDCSHGCDSSYSRSQKRMADQIPDTVLKKPNMPTMLVVFLSLGRDVLRDSGGFKIQTCVRDFSWDTE